MVAPRCWNKVIYSPESAEQCLKALLLSKFIDKILSLDFTLRTSPHHMPIHYWNLFNFFSEFDTLKDLFLLWFLLLYALENCMFAVFVDSHFLFSKHIYACVVLPGLLLGPPHLDC